VAQDVDICIVGGSIAGSAAAATFAREGYAVTALRTFELFPQTSHVETIVRLELGKKKPA